ELPGTGNSGFANTVAGEGTVSAPVIEIRVIFATVVARGDLGSPPFNPFLHRTGSRGHEIHLVDREPSPSAIDGYFGSGDDTSDVGSGAYYRDTSGFPWAMILPSGWNHPRERDQISWGYTRFAEWVTSGGETNPNWFEADLDWDYIWND
ncbi:MAG: LruC domain-containing protein, partial [Phycisphaeraceae bacterium]|nr:LruC domain-containing protein [Phycisphaeraceae bacterium]